jgi:hypothetical protein
MYLFLLISPFVQLNTAIFIRAETIYQNVATVSSKNKMLLLLFRHYGSGTGFCIIYGSENRTKS